MPLPAAASTVMLTPALVVLAPPLSVAFAVSTCGPAASPVTDAVYGGLAPPSVANTTPSAYSSTLAIEPSLSLAVAVTGTAAPAAKCVPAAGALMLTLGATFATAVTVIPTAVLVVLAPPLSTAFAVRL